ncbi:hypothetical protein Nizo1840_2421 [Lactiplantibacillus plantarum]|nr:hypothetical protein Nizo1840_2421 [Lactiplantibacillus plantarum]
MSGKILGLVLTVVFGYITYRLYKNRNIRKGLRVGLIIFTSILTVSSLFGPYVSDDSARNVVNSDRNTKASSATKTTNNENKKSSSVAVKHNARSKSNDELQNQEELISNLKKTNDDGKVTFKDNNIIVTIDNAYVVPPVTTVGDTAYLGGIFKKIKTAQNKFNTKYPIVFKDSDGVIGYAKYTGDGWYKDLTNDDGNKQNYNFKDGIEK